MKLGDKEVEYSPGFRLLLHTKASNPHIGPELQARPCRPWRRHAAPTAPNNQLDSVLPALPGACSVLTRCTLRHPAPCILPPTPQAETTLVNFTVTEEGLEEALVALVVNRERADLEEAKSQLIVQVGGGRRQQVWGRWRAGRGRCWESVACCIMAVNHVPVLPLCPACTAAKRVHH